MLVSILKNKVFFVALVTVLITQLIKVVVEAYETKKWSFEPFFSMGGMPSSHASSVMALLVSSYTFSEGGFASASFGANLIFSLIVMYDASGVRRSAGRNAEVLNRLVSHIEDFRVKRALTEEIGHTPFEVFVGALLGFLISWSVCHAIITFG